LIDPTKFNLILHPKSKGSAMEWGLPNFTKLISILPKTKFKIFVSGTADDGKLLSDFIKANPDITDLTGKLSLQQYIAFINSCNGLIAASTGPLHIAASLNKKAIGLFSSRKPIHPGRWQAVGADAHFVVFDANCKTCLSKKPCNCITKITPAQIVKLLE
jgi:heptosyltransferase III